MVKTFKQLTEFLEDSEKRKVFWLTITEQQDGSYLMCAMLVNNLSLEEKEPLGFHNKNHTAKYRVNLKPVGEGLFVAEAKKVKFDKQLFAICLRCVVDAWLAWGDHNFCGIDFGREVEEQRKIWFPASNACRQRDGELDLVLEATKDF